MTGQRLRTGTRGTCRAEPKRRTRRGPDAELRLSFSLDFLSAMKFDIDNLPVRAHVYIG